MPRAFRDEEKEQLRAKLVEVGKRLLNRMGYRSLRVEDAAREAGISKGSFYSFFPSKEDFAMEIFEAWEGQYRGALFDELRSGEGDRAARLERFFRAAFTILDREPGMARLGMGEILQIMERLPPERLAAHQAADAQAMQSAIAEWAALGIIDEADAGALVGVLSAIFVLAVHREDFAPGTYEATTALVSEALSMRLCKGRQYKKEIGDGTADMGRRMVVKGNEEAPQ